MSYEISKETFDSCKVARTYSYHTGEKIHKLSDSLIHERNGKYTLYTGPEEKGLWKHMRSNVKVKVA